MSGHIGGAKETEGRGRLAPEPNVRPVHGYIKMEPWGLSPSGPEANSKQECQDSSSEESREPSHHGTAGHPGLGIGHSHTESIPPPPDARGSEPGRPPVPPPPATEAVPAHGHQAGVPPRRLATLAGRGGGGGRGRPGTSASAGRGVGRGGEAAPAAGPQGDQWWLLLRLSPRVRCKGRWVGPPSSRGGGFPHLTVAQPK